MVRGVVGGGAFFGNCCTSSENISLGNFPLSNNYRGIISNILNITIHYNLLSHNNNCKTRALITDKGKHYYSTILELLFGNCTLYIAII